MEVNAILSFFMTWSINSLLLLFQDLIGRIDTGSGMFLLFFYPMHDRFLLLLCTCYIKIAFNCYLVISILYFSRSRIALKLRVLERWMGEESINESWSRIDNLLKLDDEILNVRQLNNCLCVCIYLLTLSYYPAGVLLSLQMSGLFSILWIRLDIKSFYNFPTDLKKPNTKF
jgi:hypothetical protein